MSILGDPPLIALGFALAWLAGMRTYLTLSAVGVAGACGLIALPHALQMIASPWIVGLCALLALAECVIDKIPGLDTGWDVLQTPVRISAGAVLCAAVLSAHGKLDTGALVVGAALAFGSHAVKSGTRALINTSPEPLSNWTASFGEDLLVFATLMLLPTHPALGLWVATCALFVGAATVLWSFRALLRFRLPRIGAMA